ncbi:hypothetical protein [Streptomyces sp. NPDC058295]
MYGTVRFNLTVSGTRRLVGGGPMHFADAWAFLDGVQAGVAAVAE